MIYYPIDPGAPFNANDLLLKMKGPFSSIIQANETMELCSRALWVNCEPLQLQQVLWHLLVNARDAIPHKGKITIVTTGISITNEYLANHPDASVGPFFCLSVSDKGCGISAKDLPHIFEPFFFPSKSKTGLGLNFCREIARTYGGWIEVKTRLGHGSTFSIFLPEVAVPK
ncbi:MAG: HAMP domain-containing sensor histidine kinase [Nitrospirales bacterium]